MKVRHLIAASTAALALGLATPALAQNTGVTEAGPGSADGNQANNNNNDNNDTASNNDNNAILSNNDNNGNDSNSASNGSVNSSQGGETSADAEDGGTAAVNGDAVAVDVEDVNVNSAAGGSNAASQGGEVEDNDGNTRTEYDTVAGGHAASRGGEVEDNDGNTDIDTDTEYDTVAGANAASRGGEVEDNDGNTRTEYDTVASGGSIAASRGGEVDVDVKQGNTEIVADQTLVAINTNQLMDGVVDLDGSDETDTAVGYNSGQNQIRGNAFAAFAGILNQAWNTGINANTQAATNIAAQGTVNFGSSGGDNGDAN